jgi:hypothetical protein
LDDDLVGNKLYFLSERIYVFFLEMGSYKGAEEVSVSFRDFFGVGLCDQICDRVIPILHLYPRVYEVRVQEILDSVIVSHVQSGIYAALGGA